MTARPGRATRLALAAAMTTALASTAPARASIIRPLGPAELAAGAERIVDGEVTAVAARWRPDHTGLETVVTIRPDAPLTAPVTIIQPGGTLGYAVQIIVGMPSYQVGERARFFLRRNDHGPGERVYGWWQGKWPGAQVGSAMVYVPPAQAPAPYFTTNGMVWPAAVMPVTYRINTAGSADLPLADVRAAVRAGFAAWQDVPCASLTFQEGADTTLGTAVDGENVVLFLEAGWPYGREAAGATSISPIPGMQTADIAMNGEHYTWVVAPSGALAASGTFDLQAVLTHEIGHFSGLSHTMSSHDTMYVSWTPWGGQRTLSADDKAGLCSIYPVAGDECDPAPCPDGQACQTTAAGRLCDSTADPIGATCHYDHIECEDFCLFTAADLSTGYCSRFCDDDRDCPLTHHCDLASAGTQTVKVCFAGAQVVPDAAPPDCVADPDCPAGEYCAAAGSCTLDCRAALDCPGGAPCDERGRCGAPADGDGGGGCGCGAAAPASAGPVLGLLALVLGRGRRRGRRPRRTADRA